MATQTPLLLAWDGSVPAQRAFEYALESARLRGLPLHVLSVLELPEVYGGSGAGQIDPQELAGANARVAALCERVRAAGVSCSSAVRVGVATELILAELRDSRAVGLVLGRSDKGVLMRWLVGSVSRGVIAQAPVPVTLVP
ncbi:MULTISPECIES: universal stress protein [Metallibacterium]|uniref:universal stress protein n=1 Tax=Metallibacterium TaxID=1218803 RepID=UPI002619B77B|nr:MULTISPECIES: universal stress protein [Metallibacterium]MBW8074794.1 hypothetical protein [Metallibacterium scheffleri]